MFIVYLVLYESSIVRFKKYCFMDWCVESGIIYFSVSRPCLLFHWWQHCLTTDVWCLCRSLVIKMSGFTEQALIKKLLDLNASQQSIQTLSLWLIHHRKHHQVIVKIWFKELSKGEQVL